MFLSKTLTHAGHLNKALIADEESDEKIEIFFFSFSFLTNKFLFGPYLFEGVAKLV